MPAPITPLRTPVLHILLALSQEDLHGLGIAESVEEASEGAVCLGPGTLYRSLKEMSQLGLIDEIEAPTGADPRRRYYRSTELGRACLSEEIRRLEHLVNVARSRRVVEPAP